jgi:hypothetical protein
MAVSEASFAMVGDAEDQRGASTVETPSLSETMMWTCGAVESVFGKNEMIERRLMNQCIEVHETIRQIKMCVDVYDHNKSPIDWMSAIVCRELNSFEIADRKRHSCYPSCRLQCLTLFGGD